MSEENYSNPVVQDNKMGTMPVNKLLRNMAFPMILSMLVQALYNIVDSIYVSRIPVYHDQALAAVGLAFPIQILLMAVANGTAVGVNALLSRALGEKDEKTVRKTAHNGIILFAISAVVFMLIGFFFSEKLIAGQGAEGITLRYGTEYLSVVCIFSFGIFTQVLFERLLQSTGRTLLSMSTQITGAVINIVLDPIMIYGWLGFPRMEVKGAAVATVVGQIVAGCLAVILNLKKNKDIRFSFSDIKPDGKTIGKIYTVGLPSIIMQAIGALMNFLMNGILYSLDELAVSVFTVYYKLQSLFFMPTFGINNGMIPIVAYNYGAGKRRRMIKTIKLSMVYAFVALSLGFLAFEFIPETLLNLFNSEGGSIGELGVPALRIIGTHFLVAWFCIIAGSVFQALGNGIYSMFVSLARQLIVLIPVAYVLAKIGGLPLVWWSFPIAEVMSLLVSTFFLIRINRRVISKVPDNE